MRSMALRRLVTLAMGTCSLAPALALTAAAVTPAALSFGMTTPLAPAPSATRNPAPSLGDFLHWHSGRLRSLRDLDVTRCVQDLEDLSPPAAQRLGHRSDAVDGLRHGLPAAEDGTFAGVFDRPALRANHVAQLVGDRPVLLAPRELPGGDQAQYALPRLFRVPYAHPVHVSGELLSEVEPEDRQNLPQRFR